MYLRETPRRHNILVSSGVRPLKAKILEILMDTMVGQWWLYRVQVMDFLVQQFRVAVRTQLDLLLLGLVVEVAMCMMRLSI